MSKIPALALWSTRDPQGPLELSLELRGAWSAESANRAETLVAAFTDAGDGGAYPKPGVSPDRSRLQIGSAARVSGPHLTFDLIADGVDGRAYQYLRHMLASVEYDEGDVLRVYVREVGQKAGTPLSPPVVTFENEGVAYPEAPSRYGFGVDWDDGPPSKRRRVMIEFANQLRRPDFDLLALPVNRWGKLLEANAFSLPEAFPDEVLCTMGQTTLFDSVTAEIEIPLFVASEVAWDSLLNLLDAFSEQVLRIALATVE